MGSHTAATVDSDDVSHHCQLHCKLVKDFGLYGDPKIFNELAKDLKPKIFNELAKDD